MNIFIAESSHGRHVPCMDMFNAKLISFTFRPSFNTLFLPIKDITVSSYIRVANPRALKVDGLTNPSEALDTFYGGDIIAMIVALHQKGEGKRIYLGYDLDSNGEYMSALLYYHLLNAGVDEENIFRVPLTQTGYDFFSFAFGTFYDYNQLVAIMEADRHEQLLMHTGKRAKMGYRNIFALDHIANRKKEKDPEVVALSNGVGMATYLTKSILNEEGTE